LPWLSRGAFFAAYDIRAAAEDITAQTYFDGAVVIVRILLSTRRKLYVHGLDETRTCRHVRVLPTDFHDDFLKSTAYDIVRAGHSHMRTNMYV